jgi:hypothetical protein
MHSYVTRAIGSTDKMLKQNWFADFNAKTGKAVYNLWYFCS